MGVKAGYISLLKRQADVSGLNCTLTYYADSGTLIAEAPGEVVRICGLPSTDCVAGHYFVAAGAAPVPPGDISGCIRSVAAPLPPGLGGNHALDIRVLPGAGWDRLVEMLGRYGGGTLEALAGARNAGAALLVPAVQKVRDAAARVESPPRKLG